MPLKTMTFRQDGREELETELCVTEGSAGWG